MKRPVFLVEALSDSRHGANFSGDPQDVAAYRHYLVAGTLGAMSLSTVSHSEGYDLIKDLIDPAGQIGRSNVNPLVKVFTRLDVTINDRERRLTNLAVAGTVPPAEYVSSMVLLRGVAELDLVTLTHEGLGATLRSGRFGPDVRPISESTTQAHAVDTTGLDSFVTGYDMERSYDGLDVSINAQKGIMQLGVTDDQGRFWRAVETDIESPYARND